MAKMRGKTDRTCGFGCGGLWKTIEMQGKGDWSFEVTSATEHVDPDFDLEAWLADLLITVWHLRRGAGGA